MIGVDYWLFNLVSFEKELIYTLFNSNKRLDIYTSFTEIARLVSVDILTADREVNYDREGLARIIANKFIRCKRFEEERRRPIKISKNLIQNNVDVNLLPFNIITTSDAPVFLNVFDSKGNDSKFEG